MMLRKRTQRGALLLGLVAGTIAFGLTRAAPIAHHDDTDLAAKIESAMSAAPSAIAKDATILDYDVDADGKFVVLREGSNGWSCLPALPSTPSTPTNGPQCYDETWMAFNYAFMAGEDPNTQVVGLAYMLQGGNDASNTDPLATEPAVGEDWVTSPAHVMILFPGDIDQSVYSPDHHSGGPFIMWAGTPYEHIMMPVAEGEPMR